MQRRVWTGVGALLLAALAGSAAAENDFVSIRILSADSANTAATAALHDCAGKGYQVAVAVTDRSGNLLALLRDPLAGHHTTEVATRKAYTAATFQTPTLELQSRDFAGLRHASNVLMVGGGVPIRVGGHFYGAIGVSGAPAKKLTGDIDDGCAHAGIEAVREALEFAQ